MFVIREDDVTYVVIFAALILAYLYASEISKILDAAGGASFIADEVHLDEAIARTSSGFQYAIEGYGVTLPEIEGAAAIGAAVETQGLVV